MLNNLKMKTKLILIFVLTGLVPMLIIASISYYQAKNALTDETFKQIHLYNSMLKTEFEEYFNNKLLFASNISTNEIIKTTFNNYGNENEWQKTYKSLDIIMPKLSSEFGFDGIFITDSTGDVIYATDKYKVSEGANLSNRTYFQNSMKGDANISEYMYSKIINSYFVLVSSPVKNANNKIIGTVNMFIPVETIQNTLTSSIDMIGKDADIYLVDEKGLLYTDTAFGESSNEGAFNINIETKAVNLLKPAIVNKDSEFIAENLYTNYIGTPVIGGYTVVNIGDTTLGLIVELAQSEAFTSVKTLMNLIIIVVLIISILSSILLLLFVERSITRPINKLKLVAEKLAVGDINSTIDITSKDEIGILADTFSHMILGIKYQTEIIRKIADGENDITVDIRSEDDLLNIKLKEAVDNLNILRTQTQILIEAVKIGDLQKRGNEKILQGTWSNLIKGINQLIDGFVMPITSTNTYITRIGNGDIPEIITDEYFGEFNNIKESLNNCIISINRLVLDTDMLIQSAIAGDLKKRADSTKHFGEYRKIILGINQTIDAIVNPITEASDVLQNMSVGDLSVSVIGNYKGDHSVIKNALNITIERMNQYIFEISEVLEKMTKDDLNCEIKSEFKGDFSILKESLNCIILRFNQVLSEIDIAAEQVSSASNQVSYLAQNLSQGATEQSSAVEEITASIEQVTDKTKISANNAHNTNNLIKTIMDSALQGNDKMEEMKNAMKDINIASENISKIIRVIDDIAFQTNILALNAAVEAARAGEYGKGFAVVAEEVRNLATRSANATKETSILIENSIQKVNNGNKIANETASVLENIVTGISDSTKAINDITLASKEQSAALVQISEGMNQIAIVTQKNTETSEKSAAASEEMTAQAQILKEMVEKFELKM